MSDTQSDDGVVSWLLGKDQPSIRYLALTELLGKGSNDPEVKWTKERISKHGWAAKILSRRRPSGRWATDESLWRPKYVATFWILLVLSELRVPRNAALIESCELVLNKFAKDDGGFGYDSMRTSEMCITANSFMLLSWFGFGEDPRVKSALDWILNDQKENGGWRCGWRRGIIDGWEPMALFASIPKEKRTPRISRAIERGAEFYLDRELHREGKRYEPWYRFHYPVFYYYDILVGLDFMTKLGYGDDNRLMFGLELLKSKMRPDRRWGSDAVHPDLEGEIAELYSRRPPIPFALERVGRPSRMITLKAMSVLKRVDGLSIG